MPQSLSKMYLHIVFSTKYRERIIHDEVRLKLHAYMVKTFSALGSYVHEIYANPDHVHILCQLPRTITVADLLSKVKSSSSKWLKTQGIDNFTWQRGYAVFSVSEWGVLPVQNYIKNQYEHHKTKAYQDEVRDFLKEYKVEYDEKYMWD